MALRLPALIVATILSLYAAWWMFTKVSIGALFLNTGIMPFLLAVLYLFCGIAALTGIGQGWRARHSKGAWGEALLGFLLMAGIMLFRYLWKLIA